MGRSGHRWSGVLARTWRRNWGVEAPRFPRIAVTDGLTRVTHWVSREAMSEGLRAGGRYQAVCGAQLGSALFIEPGQQRCLACEQ